MLLENTEAYNTLLNHIGTILPEAVSERIIMTMSHIVKDPSNLRISTLMSAIEFIMSEGVYVARPTEQVSHKRDVSVLNAILEDTRIRVVPVGDNYEVIISAS